MAWFNMPSLLGRGTNTRRAAPPKLPSRVPSRRTLLLEALEPRLLLSADPLVTLSSGLLNVQLTDFNDTALVEQIGFNGAGAQIRLLLNGAESVHSGVQGITLEGLGGSDTITIGAIDFAAAGITGDLLFYGDHAGAPTTVEDSGIDSVTFVSGLSSNGGYLEVFADHIQVNAGVTLSTLDGADGAGDIVFRARSFNVPELENLSPLLVQTKSVSIDIGIGARLEGAGIYLISQAEDRSIADINGVNRLVDQLLISPATDKLAALTALPAKVLVRGAESSIVLREGAQIDGDGTVGIYATAASASKGTANSKVISVGYAGASASAEVDIHTGVTIRSTAGVVITSDADASAEISSETSKDLGDVPAPADFPFALSVAVSNADVSSKVTVAQGASIEAGKTANVRAQGGLTSSAEAKAGMYSNGAAGLAFGIELSFADVQTRVDGSIKAFMEPIERVQGNTATLMTPLVKLEFDPKVTDPNEIGYIDYANNTINVGHTSLVTEDQVTYNNRRGNDIGGLVSGNPAYYVISVADDPDTDFDESTLIKLALTEQHAIDGVAIDLHESPIPVALNEKTFGAGDVDGAANTVTLANPAFTGAGTINFSLLGSTFELGQAVVYHQDAGSPAIEGLVDGGTYYIITGTNEFNLQGDNRFTEKQVVQLAESENEARAGIAIDIGAAPAGAGGTFAAKHVLDSDFATGIGVIANLTAEDKATAESGLASHDFNDDGSGWAAKLTGAKDVFNDSLINTLMSKLTEDYQAPAGTGASSQLSVAGALAFSLGRHDVRANVGGTALLQSNEDLEVKANITEKFQLSAQSDSEPQETTDDQGQPSAPTTVSVAVAVGVYDNDARATVESGAQLDGLRATRVIAGVNYPFLTRPDEFFPSTLGELVDQLQNEGYGAVNDYLDGTLGIQSKLLNSFARSTASAEDLAIAGSVNVLVFDNTALATVESGVQINQDADWRDASLNDNPNQGANQADGLGEQVVSIEATNYMQTVNVTGNFQLSLPSLSLDPFSPDWDKGNLNPLGGGDSKSRGGVGGSIFVGVLNNTTKAVVEDDVAIFSGGDGGFNMKAEEAILTFTLSQSGAAAGKFAIAGTVAVFVQDSDTVAQLSDQAVVTGRNARLYAGSLETNINWAGGIAFGKALGLGISVAVNDIDRDTRALIGDANPLAAGGADADTRIAVSDAVALKARNDGALWAFTVAGGIAGGKQQPSKDPLDGESLPILFGETPAQGAQTGIAAAGAASVNLVRDTVQASIADAGVIEANSLALDADNATDLVAATGGLAFSLALSGDSAAGIAGAFSYNELAGGTRAFLQDTDLTLAGTSGDTLAIEATRGGRIIAIGAGASGAVSGPPDDGGGNQLAASIAGSASINFISDTTEARLSRSNAVLAGGNATLSAVNEADIFAIGGGLSLALTLGGQSGSSTAAAFGVAIAVNRIDSHVSALVEHAGVEILGSGSLRVEARSAATIQAFTLGGAVSAAAGTQGTGAAGAGAGSGSVNLIDAETIAALRSSEVTLHAGSLDVAASDSSEITAAAGGIALAVGLSGQGSAGSVAFGGAFAVNLIGYQDGNVVLAEVDDSAVDTSGHVTVEAESIGAIYALAIGAAGSVSASGSNALAGSLAGSVSYNRVRANTQAKLRNGSSVDADGALKLEATDASEITADAGGFALAIAAGQSTAIGVAVGGALSINDIGVTLRAEIADSEVIDAHGLTVRAASDAEIDAWSFVGSLAVAGGDTGIGIAGGGAGSANVIANTVEARIHGSDVALGGGALTVSASDGSSIDADSGSAAFALGAGNSNGVGIAVGAGLSINRIDNSITAAIDDSDVDAAAGVAVTATSGADIRSFSFGLGGSAGGGSSVGLSLAGAGSGAGNDIANHTTARIDASSVDVDGALTVHAVDDAKIDAFAGAVAIAIGASGSVGVGVSLGVSVSRNEIDNQTRAFVRDSSLTDVSGVSVSAESTSAIRGITIAGAASVGAGVDVGVAFAGAGAVSLNRIDNTLEATIESSSLATTPGAAFKVAATDHASISADAGALALAIGVGQYAGIGAAIGASVAINDIGNTTRAAIEDTTVTGTTLGALQVLAESESSIDSHALTISGAVGASIYAGIALAGSGAMALNTIANTTEALVRDSVLPLASSISVMAQDQADITSSSVGETVSISVGIAAVSLSFGASVSINKIHNSTTATVDDSLLASAGTATVSATGEGTIDATAVGLVLSGSIGGGAFNSALIASVTDNTVGSLIQARVLDSDAAGGQGLSAAGNILVKASDRTDITANAIAGGVSASFSAGGGSVTVVATPATNRIDNVVRAAIDHSSVQSSNGRVDVSATSEGDIATSSTAVAISIDLSSAGITFSVTGAGSSATNDIGTLVEARITAGSDVRAGKELTVKAADSSTIDAQVLATSFSLATISVATGVSTTDNDIHNTVSAHVDGSSATAGANDLEITADATQAINSKAIAVAASISVGGAVAGGFAKNDITTGVQAHASDAQLRSPGTVRIAANSTLSADTIVAGGGAGAIGISAMRPEAHIGGLTQAYASGTSTIQAAGLDVHATAVNNVVADAVSVGLGVGGGAGAGASASIDRRVDAHLGAAYDSAAPSASTIHLGGGTASVQAFSTSNATSSAIGGAIGGVSIVAFISEATITGSTRAYIGQATTLAAGSLDLDAHALENASATAIPVGAGILTGSGARAIATVASLTEAFVGAQRDQATAGGATVLDLSGTADIDAFGDSMAVTDISGGSGGALAINVMLTDAHNSANTRAYVGRNADVTAGQLTVDADGQLGAQASTFVINIGILAGTGTRADATIDGDVEAWIGANAGSALGAVSTRIDVAGAVTVGAKSTAASSASTEGATGSAIGVSAMLPTAKTHSDTRAWIGSGVELTAGTVDVDATAVKREARVFNSLISISLLAGGSGVDAHASVEGTVQAFIGGSASSFDVGGAIKVLAQTSEGIARSSAKLGAGGLLGDVSVVLSTASNQASTQAWVADGTVAHAASLHVNADSKDMATANGSVGSGGLISGRGVKADVDVKPKTQAWIGADTRIGVSGDVSVSAVAQTVEGDANATSAGGGGISVGVAFANIDVRPTVTASIRSGTRIEAGGDVTVSADLRQQQTGEVLTDQIKHSDINLASDTLTFKQHGLATGDVVRYVLDGGAAIATATSLTPLLAEGRDYSVIAIGDNTLALGNAFNGSAIDAGSPFGPAAGSSGIDAARDLIVFGAAHNFQTGDAVIYDHGSFSSVVAGTQLPIYIVRVIDERSIKLTPSTAAAQAPLTAFNVNAGGLVSNGNELNIAGFANGDHVTYRAPAPVGFSSKAVDAVVSGSQPNLTVTDNDNNEIYLGRDLDGDGDLDAGHGLNTGDRVVYRSNGAPIGGLVDGQPYYVIRLSDYTLQLAASLDATNPDDDDDGPNVGVTPINLSPDKSDAAIKVKHLLVPTALGGLTSGSTYTVVSVDADTFRLRDANGVIVAAISVGEASGTHFIGKEGLDLVTGGGTDKQHTLRIDLTGVNAGAVNLLLGPGDTSLRSVSPPIGDGQSSASAKGGGGGFADVQVPTARALFRADVQASIDADRIRADGDVAITALSDAKVTSYANSRSGGFIQIGDTSSSVDYGTRTNAFVGHAAPGVTIANISDELALPQLLADDVDIDAAGQFRMLAQTRAETQASASGKGGGFISVSVVHADADVAARTNAIVGRGATITARSADLNARVDRIRSHVSSEATAGGFAGAATANANTRTDSGTLVLLEGTTDHLTRISALQGMDLEATHATVDTTRHTDHHFYGLFGGSSGPGDNKGSVKNLVDGDAGVIVTVAPRPTQPATSNATPPSPLDTVAGFNHLALLAKANNGATMKGVDQDRRTIHWDSDVIVRSGPAPELVIDANGFVVRATNITVNGIDNPAPNTNFSGASQLEVADITNNDLGEIVFQARHEISGGVSTAGHYWGTFTFDDGFDSVRITNESNKALWLNDINMVDATGQPRVHLDRGGDSVSLNFAIARTLGHALVDVRNLGSGDIVLRNGKGIDNPVGETRLLNTGGAIVAEAGAAANYLIRTRALGDATSATAPVDFEREAAGQRRYEGVIALADNGAAADRLTRQDGSSWLAGGFQVGDLVKIEVDGQTPFVVQIAAFAGGNHQIAVLSTQAALSTQTVEAFVSRFHGIEAAQSVGTLAQPVRIEMVNASDQVAQLFGEAGQNLVLDLRVRERGVEIDPDPLAAKPVAQAHVDLLTAKGDTVVTLHAGVVEAGLKTAGGVLVTVQGKGAPESATYFNFYRPDATVSGQPIKPTFPQGAFATGPATTVDTTYDFGLAEAGQHVRIAAADDSAPDGDTWVVNLLGQSNILAGGGFVDLLTNGFVGTEARPWSEIVAVDPADGDDLRIGRIRSTADDVFLLAPRSLVDADPADNDTVAAADVSGINITLRALSGAAGSTANFLETDLIDSVGGTRRAGDVHGRLLVATEGGVWIEEVDGHLRLDTVLANLGNVSLAARAGSILDFNDETDAGGEDIANVTGVHIDLAAQVDIGTTDDDLDIDSGVLDGGYVPTGRVYAQAQGSIYLTETDRELNLLAARSFAGDVRLTVPDTALTPVFLNGDPSQVVTRAEDLYLLANDGGAGAQIAQGAALTVSQGEVYAFLNAFLWIGDNVVTTAASRIVAGNSITIRGDQRRVHDDDTDLDTPHALDADAGYGSNMLLRGTIGRIGAPADVNAANPNAKTFTQIFGHDDVDLFTFDQTRLDANTSAYGSAFATPGALLAGVQADGEDRFVVNKLKSMHVDRNGIGDTLTLDGQGGTDYYLVQTMGSAAPAGERHHYVVNVLDTGAERDGADELRIVGADSADIFLLRGMQGIPSESAEAPAFVALLQGTIEQARAGTSPGEVERINYDAQLNGRLIVEGRGGDDHFAVDDNSAITTLDGGAGNDSFQIGQIYGTQRTDGALGANLAPSDTFGTVATTRGYVSRGISQALVALGGTGDDVFTVYSNQAELRLEGNAGDDLFIVRAFALAETHADGSIVRTADGVAVPRIAGGLSTAVTTDLLPGEGDDQVMYNMNAPVSIDGGTGFDKVVVLGTEFADNFVITDKGVFGAGVSVRFANIEVLEVDGLEGDDHFTVQSTPFGVITRLIGGLGNDTFNIASDVTDIVATQGLDGHSAIVNHQLASADLGYDGLLARGIDLAIAGLPFDDPTGGLATGNVIIDESGGPTDGRSEVRESAAGVWGSVDSYTVRLAREVAAGTVVYVTVSASRSPQEEQDAAGQGDSVLVSTSADFVRTNSLNGATETVRNRSVVLVFTADNWDQAQTVYVAAANDSLEEGPRVVAVSHSVQAVIAAPAADADPIVQAALAATQQATLADYHRAKVRNVEVNVIDNDAAGLVITELQASPYDQGTLVLEGAHGITDTYTVQLTKAPTAAVTVTLHNADGQLVLSQNVIVFTADNWNQPVTISVSAADDTLREDPKAALITHTLSSSDLAYNNLREQLAVTVVDDDTPGVLVRESSGSTQVTTGGVTDTYIVRLTSAPTAPVFIMPVNDGLTTESPSPLMFDASNWWIDQTVTVTAVADPAPALLHPGVKQFAVQPHLLSALRGPLEINGGVGVDVHPLVEAVLLPAETNTTVFPIAQQPPENQSIDTLNVFDDSSLEDKSGTLTATRLFGFEMAGDLHFDHVAFGEKSSFAGGITYGADDGSSAIEVFNLLLGSGNDALDILGTLSTDALHGGITTIHGGGNLSVQAPVAGHYTGSIMGDTIRVLGGGGPGSPLVIYGDTSQDASWYGGIPYRADTGDRLVLGPNPNDSFGASDTFYRYPRANPFDFAGNDLIDARGLFAGQSPNVGVTIYGGAGNDTIFGSEAGDHIAGGSGDDVIDGGAGLDHLYGDSGINVDVVTRVLTIPTVNASVVLNADGLLAGKDTISGQDGDDIIFGDHGIVDQHLAANQKLLTVFQVMDIRTDQPMNGDDDVIHGNAGRDRLFGGNGADVITGGAGADVIFGDHGHLGYESDDADLTTLDVIESIDTAIGGADIITDDAGDDIIVGGFGGDSIDAGAGSNVVFGDHGLILGIDSGFNQPPFNDPPSSRRDDYQLTLAYVSSLVPAGEHGGNDIITTGIGRDMIFGGAGDDTINAFASSGGTAALDGNNIVFGDYGLVDYLSEELLPSGVSLQAYLAGAAAAGAAGNPIRPNDIDRVWSLASATALGGHDTIWLGHGNDIVLGGTGDDLIDAGQGVNIVLGDNGKLTAAEFDFSTTPFSVHEFTVCTIETIGFDDADSGDDTITGSDLNDLIFGGGGGDTIYAGGGDDLVFGDQGMVKCANGQPFDPGISLRPVCVDLGGFLEFHATNVDRTSGSGDDVIFGQDGSDVIMGQQGRDVLYGGNGDDILIGGSNVAGALDSDDRIDGGAGADAIAGDNADICFRADALDVRMRTLDRALIYGVTEGIDDGRLLIGVGAANADNIIDPLQPVLHAMNDPRYAARSADKNSGHAQYHIELLDHADDTSPTLYGNDDIAGGAGEDEIFGQLGHDVIQGDGTIGVQAGANFARNLVAAQLSLTRTDGSLVEITDFTRVGANRGPVAQTPAEFGFTLDPSQDLVVRASFEGLYDGDDYIEGNGGNDVIFGNRGQDDLIGGSSDLFGLVAATQRPDGSDLIFGGAGTDIARNDIGDATTARSAGLPSSAADDLIVTSAGGHAHDADVIVGDNGRILRLVGIDKTQRGAGDILAAGVRSSGGFLNYNYDVGGLASEGWGSDGNAATYDRIVVRGVDFLDYHEGGIDVSDAAASDRGAGDELHGESGDDILYGMKGNDVLYGEGQDDDLIGGYGNDWISGGTGQDGAIGDDGRILVSRNATTYGEALNGVAALLPDNGDTRTFNGNMMNEVIATPGSIQQAVVHIGGELKKAVNLTPFSFDTTFSGQWDEFTSVNRKTVDDQGRPDAHNADDIIFGGLGSDWLHGGSGDDAMLGGEALNEAYTQVYDANGMLAGVARSDYRRPFNPVDALRYNPTDVDGWHFDRTRRAGEFALYDEYDPLRKITLNPDGTANKTDAGGLEWFLNFSTTEGTYVPAATNPKPVGQTAPGYPQAWDDGTDRLFGDTGNDWLVGGTGRDDLYGGFGNDLLNADDEHATHLGRNDQPDTQASYEDRAFGGAGRDVLIGNTGGDRLIDWVGEFNSYLVPFAPFGMATVSRTLQPQLAEFLYTLSASDGADPTRWADTNADPAQRFRNGEPEGELGLVRQQDFAWQTQTGAPADPQAGNIPGGHRDVLRTANFNDGSMQALAPDSGTWQVGGGALQVAATSNKGDAVAVYQVGDALPSYFEVQATIKVIKPTAGWNANSYVIFDYQSPTQFKFAGLDVSTNKLVMGQRTDAGWEVLKQAAYPGSLKNETWYNVMLAVNGLTATLIVNNTSIFSHTYEPTVVDGWSYGLNWGLVGFGSNKSRGAMDNIAVQVVPPSATAIRVDDFTGGAGSMLTGVAGSSTGVWSAAAGRVVGSPGAGSDTAMQLLNLSGVTQLQPTSLLQISTTFSTSGLSGIVFDRYSDTDFKWAAVDTVSKQVLIGHRTAAGWFVDAAASRSSLLGGLDVKLGVSIKGSTVSVTLDDQAALGFTYNAAAADGRFGLFSKGGAGSFDSVTVKTDDPSVPAAPELRASSAGSAGAAATPPSDAELQALTAAALRRLDLDPSRLAALGAVSVRVTELPGLALGVYVDGTILIDDDAAGHGWFIDATPGDDVEYRRGAELLVARPGDAAGRIDLLSVLAHELGHAAGLEHADAGLMSERLDPGVRSVLAAVATSDLRAAARPAPFAFDMPWFAPAASPAPSAEQAAPAPVIDWSPRPLPPVAIEAGARQGEWVDAFVNHGAKTQAQRHPNAALKVQVELPVRVTPNLSALAEA